MNPPEDLPPKVAPPGFSATGPGLDAARVRGRRRRRRQAWAVSGGGTGLATGVAFLLLTAAAPPHAIDRLLPAVGPRPSTSATPAGTWSTPAPSATGATSATSPTAATGAPASPSAGPTGTGGSAVQASPGTATTSPRPAAGEVGPPHTVVSYVATRRCTGTGPTPANGWCSYYDGATSAARGTTAALALAVCRLPAQAAADLYFDNGQQADFTAGDNAHGDLWSWSHGRRFDPRPLRITLAPGTCLRWAVTWDLADDSHQPLPAGTYYLAADPFGSTGPGATAYTTNPVTFTIT